MVGVRSTASLPIFAEVARSWLEPAIAAVGPLYFAVPHASVLVKARADFSNTVLAGPQEHHGGDLSHNLAVRQCLLELLDALLGDFGVGDVQLLELTQPLQIHQPSVRDFGVVEPQADQLT